MRYENWDVLLFSDESKAPIQEFKTQCFVTKDLDSPYLKYHSTFGAANTYFYPHHGNVGQLPILTTFIPSVPKDTGFRVSIHNWEKPRPSRLIESVMQLDDMLLYEARVYVDGDCVGGGIFSQRANWPYLINFSSQMDRDGNQDVLRFPQFHSDILEQRHWDAGDSYGRIKIVLTEGFSRPHRSPPFERVKDVVALSFQHAPLNILEYSNIAWPNPSMWHRKYSSASIDTKDAEGHAHNTPTKESRAPLQLIHGQVVPRAAPPPTFYTNWATSSIFDVPISHWPAYSTQDPRWDIDQENDIFTTDPNPAWQQRGARSSREDVPIDPAWQHRGARASRDDIPMLDYSSSNSRAISSVTGMSFEHSKQPSMAALMDEEDFTVLQESITLSSPSTIIKSRKEKTSGTGNSININKDDEKENEKGIEKVVETAVEKEKEDNMVTPKKV
ncbi:hypothetical protein N7481_007239 [Penicillium waksmanii]|uniref:uncharacterized protein n=1 Tax=Penicillium waksmanii TaxID=69791 RepID=UPI0025485C9B|nr:uncharacterized protein N7481_007239 [Penicillium waksmanii]KAJ5979941.1 hypothetical protein N7481_007239 [Penicillium waksmanii]